jgi:hypothetical protein
MEQNDGQERDTRDTIQKDPNTLEALVTTIITEIQTTTKSSEETIRGGKRLIEVETSTLRRWQEKLCAVRDASGRVPDNNTLSKVLANTEEIKKQLNTRPQPSAPTWSQIAASIPTPPN